MKKDMTDFNLRIQLKCMTQKVTSTSFFYALISRDYLLFIMNSFLLIPRWVIISQMRKHRSASGITAFNSMIYAAGGENHNISKQIQKLLFNLYINVFYLKAMMDIAFLNQSSAMILKMVMKIVENLQQIEKII